MISLVISGAHQGVEAWLDELRRNHTCHFVDACDYPNVEEMAKIASTHLDQPTVFVHAEAWCRSTSEAEVLTNLMNKMSMAIVSIAEMGAGLVPISPQDRSWRECVGRTTTMLAKSADTVVRLVAGLPQVLKENLHHPTKQLTASDLLQAMQSASTLLKITFVRHGLTAANLERRYLGRQDVCLCTQGVFQLEQEREQVELVERVFASPMQRTRQTASLIWPDAPLEIVSGLMERDFGIFDHLTYEDLKDNQSYRDFISSCGKTTPPQGETYVYYMKRVASTLAYIIATATKLDLCHVGVVSHGGPLMLLLALLDNPTNPSVNYDKQMSPGKTVTVLVPRTLANRLN